MAGVICQPAPRVVQHHQPGSPPEHRLSSGGRSKSLGVGAVTVNSGYGVHVGDVVTQSSVLRNDLWLEVCRRLVQDSPGD